MRKRQNSKQEGELINLKKTFPNYKLTDPLTLARLRVPNDFPYAHRARLYHETSETISQLFRDLHVIFHTLPISYRIKIISESSFQRFFTDQIFEVLDKQTKKKSSNKKLQDEPNTFELFAIYQSFFNIGVEGLVNTMPVPFRQDLLLQVKTIVNFMRSISDFARQANPKLKIPVPYIPSSLAEVRGYGL